MKVEKIINDVKYVYDENMWSGSKALVINDQPAKKKSRTSFSDADGNIIVIKGSYITGVKLLYGDGRTVVLSRLAGWQYPLLFLPFVTFALSLALNGGGIPGGISGLLSGAGMFANAYLMQQPIHNALKVILSIVISGICLLIFIALAALVFALL